MKKVAIIMTSCVLFSCAGTRKDESDFVEKILDVATATSSREYSSGELIELPQLYDTLATDLPEDNEEKILLVERLEKRGFAIIDRGRGNFPPLGPRIVIVELKKGDCVCEVHKSYQATLVDTAYQMVEGINCKRLPREGVE